MTKITNEDKEWLTMEGDKIIVWRAHKEGSIFNSIIGLNSKNATADEAFIYCATEEEMAEEFSQYYETKYPVTRLEIEEKDIVAIDVAAGEVLVKVSALQ